MKYAVVETGGKQYRVSTGDVITVDRLPDAKDATFTFEKVLLLATENAAEIGAPYLSDVTVLGKVLELSKGEKIFVSKFKAKAKHRRKTGFRASLTRVQIVQVSKKGDKEEIKETKASEETKVVAKKTRVKKVA